MFSFKNLIISIIILLTLNKSINCTNSAWSKCGGENWSSSSECATGTACYVQDRYFSQCRPLNDCPTNWNCSIYQPPPYNSSNHLSAWSQCGGLGWSSKLDCVYDYACYIENTYFSQCRPLNDCPTNWNCSINNPNSNPTNQISGWGQCAGQNWNSDQNCISGYVCYIKDDYYAQCRPVNDCPTGWSCTIKKTTTNNPLTTTSNLICLSTQFYDSKRNKCQEKLNYAKACSANNQCKESIGLYCRSHKYYCNCPLVNVGFHYCDCSSQNFYSYSAKKCGK